MNTEISGSQSLVKLPVQPPKAIADEPALVQRLVSDCGATWVDEKSVGDWAALGGDRVVLLAGDAVRFPEGQDVAVVLPELRRSASRPFEIAVVPRHKEELLARRYGSKRWPTLLFLRDGQYVTTLPGMHDWDDYVNEVERALAMPVSRAPTIGIPVVSASAGATDSSCH